MEEPGEDGPSPGGESGIPNRGIEIKGIYEMYKCTGDRATGSHLLYNIPV
jgi:hypothetical protein